MVHLVKQYKINFLQKVGPQNDIIIFSKVRLLRNLAEFPFLFKIKDDELIHFFEQLKRIGEVTYLEKSVNLVLLSELAFKDIRYLQESSYLTNDVYKNKSAIFFFDADHHSSIIVGKNDHFCLQTVLAGSQLFKAFEKVNTLDDWLNNQVDYAFNPQLGYLTANPANLGTALSASVLLNIPAIKKTNCLAEIVKLAGEFNIVLQAFTVNEQSIQNLLFLETQFSLGKSEYDTLEELKYLLDKIVELENEKKEELWANDSQKIKDEVLESYNYLKNANSLTYIEAISKLTNLTTGIYFSLLTNIDFSLIANLIIDLQKGHLAEKVGITFKDLEEENNYRASYLASVLK